MLTKKIAVLYHVFYEDTYEHIYLELKHLQDLNVTYFFNLCADMPNCLETKDYLEKHFKDCYVTISSNKGKDIGGKLLLLNLCLKLNVEFEWIIFLHDKKSLQALNAKTWKSDLLKIISKNEILKISKAIINNTQCGIIASKDYLKTEFKQKGKFEGKNGAILSELTKVYGLNCKKYSYVAGTMFWAKASALIEFFKTNDPLAIRRTLETGNVIDNFNGTNTHSWERMLSWILLSQGLEIETV
jgi:lipopolysaccharide biosynthesis protein